MASRTSKSLTLRADERSRRGQRRRIWELLHAVCLKVAALQRTEEARLACHEVAAEILAARRREGGLRGGRG